MPRRAGHGENWGVGQLTRRDRSQYGRSAVAILAILGLAACSPRPQVGVPPVADIEAATEAKPKPTAAILTDPDADALYNSAVEGWGDRVRAAGLRLCRFYKRTGMEKLVCPAR